MTTLWSVLTFGVLSLVLLGALVVLLALAIQAARIARSASAFSRTSRHHLRRQQDEVDRRLRALAPLRFHVLAENDARDAEV